MLLVIDHARGQQVPTALTRAHVPYRIYMVITVVRVSEDRAVVVITLRTDLILITQDRAQLFNVLPSRNSTTTIANSLHDHGQSNLVHFGVHPNLQPGDLRVSLQCYYIDATFIAKTTVSKLVLADTTTTNDR